MKRTTFQLKNWLLCCMMVIAASLVGCSTDDSIDVSKVDTTMGVLTSGFNFPVGATSEILLGDVLKLNQEDCVRTKDKDDSQGKKGDYEFFRKGDPIEPAKPQIKEVVLEQDKNQTYSQNFKVNIPAAARGEASVTAVGDIEIPAMPIEFLNYGGTKDTVVLKLDHARLQANIRLSIDVTTLNSLFSKVSMSFQFPDFMEIVGEDGQLLTDNRVTFNDVTTSRVFTKDLSLIGLTNFKTVMPATLKNELVLNRDEMGMQGEVIMAMSINPANVTNPLALAAGVNKTLNTSITIDDKISITEATGYFCPTVNLDNLGDVVIGDEIPDFLTDDNVHIHLKKPIITVRVKNNINTKGYINGTIHGFYKDGTKKTLNMHDVTIRPHAGGATDVTTSVFYVCRAASDVKNPEPNAEFVVLDGKNGQGDIADLLTRIPDRVTFECEARVDPNYKTTVKLGDAYEIAPDYDIYAPLSLEAGSVIVYDDQDNGWNKDINDNDIDLRGETQLTVIGKVTNDTPLELLLDATPVDENGNDLSSQLQVEVKTNKTGNIISSLIKDTTPTELTVIITSLKEEGIKTLDGLKFKVKATSISENTLNKDIHKVKITDIKATLKGGVSFDADSKNKD